MADNIQVSYDLSSQTLPAGNSKITATALATGLTESKQSTAVTYTSDYLACQLLSDSTYAVVGFSENYTGVANVIIPSEYSGLPVTEIAMNAFKDNKMLEKVTIPTSIARIGMSAFENCTNLTSVEFKSDPYYTIFFRNTRGWTNICCAERRYGSYTYGDPGREMTLDSNDGFGTDFYAIRVLKADLNSIKFSGLNKNTGEREYSAEISDSECGEYYCWEMKYSYTSESSAVSRYKDFTPHGLSIQWDAFKNTSIKAIKIPASVGTIQEGAFEDCTSLSSVSLPTTFKIIGDSVFSGCISLTSISIPEGATTIGRYAFRQTGLTNVTIPKGISKMGTGAFANCLSLTSVTFNNSGTISDYAFSYCTYLSTLSYGGNCGITAIGIRAFEGTALTSIVIPASVTWIGADAFWGITTLQHASFNYDYGWFHTLQDGKYDGEHWNANDYYDHSSQVLASFFTRAEGFANRKWYRLEQMTAPVISLTESILTITDSTGLAESFKIYINGEDCLAHIDVNGNLIAG